MAIRIRLGPRGSRNRIEPLIGGLICAALSLACFYAAFGDVRLGGGVPLIPASWNQLSGRIAFGIGGVLVGALALYAFHECLRPLSKSLSSDSEP